MEWNGNKICGIARVFVSSKTNLLTVIPTGWLCWFSQFLSTLLLSYLAAASIKTLLILKVAIDT